MAGKRLRACTVAQARGARRVPTNSAKPMTELATNVLYYGDNLDILRRYLPDASAHLPAEELYKLLRDARQPGGCHWQIAQPKNGGQGESR